QRQAITKRERPAQPRKEYKNKSTKSEILTIETDLNVILGYLNRLYLNNKIPRTKSITSAKRSKIGSSENSLPLIVNKKQTTNKIIGLQQTE
ncbi:MAG: hypothetical protein V1651_03985, partial [Patescibacteria group bacterium]